MIQKLLDVRHKQISRPIVYNSIFNRRIQNHLFIYTLLVEIVLTWRWCSSSVLLFSFLFKLVFNLSKYRLRVHSTTIKLALISKQIFNVVFLQSKSSTSRGAYVDVSTNFLPLLWFSYLKTCIKIRLGTTYKNPQFTSIKSS